jgi:hypothetical protein
MSRITLLTAVLSLNADAQVERALAAVSNAGDHVKAALKAEGQHLRVLTAVLAEARRQFAKTRPK